MKIPDVAMTGYSQVPLDGRPDARPAYIPAKLSKVTGFTSVKKKVEEKT